MPSSASGAQLLQRLSTKRAAKRFPEAFPRGAGATPREAIPCPRNKVLDSNACDMRASNLRREIILLLKPPWNFPLLVPDILSTSVLNRILSVFPVDEQVEIARALMVSLRSPVASGRD